MKDSRVRVMLLFVVAVAWLTSTMSASSAPAYSIRPGTYRLQEASPAIIASLSKDHMLPELNNFPKEAIRQTTVKTNREDCVVVIIDGDTNGKWDYVKSLSSFGMNTDRIGLFHEVLHKSGGWSRSGESMPLCQVILYGGRFYTLAIDGAGDQLTISAYRGPMGRVTFRAADGKGRWLACSGELAGDTGMFTVDNSLALPVGEYRALGWISSGKAWADSRKPNGERTFVVKVKQPISLSAKAGTEIRLGGVMTAEIEPGAHEIDMKPGESRSLKLRFLVGADVLDSTFDAKPKGKAYIQGPHQHKFGLQDVDFNRVEGPTYKATIPSDWQPGVYKLCVSFDPRPYQKQLFVSKTLRVKQ